MPAEDGVIIYLKHAKDVLLELDVACCKIVHWVQSEEMAVRAAYEDMLLTLIILVVADA